MVNKSCPRCGRNARYLPCVCIFNCDHRLCKGK